MSVGGGGERGELRECESMSYAHVCVRLQCVLLCACVCVCLYVCVRPKSYTKYKINKIPSHQQNKNKKGR